MRTLTRGHKAIRIASAVLIGIIILMILGPGRLVRLDNPLMALAYWALCFGLVLFLIVLALLDLRYILMSYGEERKRVLRSLAEREKEE